MKLHLSILKNLINFPQQEPQELRRLLDDLGLEVKDVLGQADNTIYNIETLANRGDHLSALGVARELAARLLTPISYPKLAPEFLDLRKSIKLSVETDLCSRYALLEASQSKAIELRPEISICFADEAHPETPIVDICNYLALELGHPTHAFDYDKIEGEIVVEVLSKEEKILALDGKEYTVPAGAIVNRDRKKIVAVAGIIGCANSMVTASTKRYLIEAAAFDPVSVRKTARAMGISTDASYAFERGVDREAVIPVLRRLIALSTNLGDDGLQVHALSYFEGQKTEVREIVLNLDEVRRQFNLSRLSDVEMQSRLKFLGYTLSPEQGKNNIKVQVPSWRLWDVEKESDLIEDLARSISLSQIKLKLPDLDFSPPPPTKIEQVIYDLEIPLQGLGFREVMTKNLYSNEEVSLLQELQPDSAQQHISIKNALEKNCSHLKITNILHLAKLFDANLKRGVTSFKVYENARLFRKNFERLGHPYESELDVLSFAIGGRIRNSDFRKSENTEESFYWFKGAIETFLNKLGIKFDILASKNLLLHPGRQAILSGKDGALGFFGQIHPKLQSKLELTQPILYCELDLFLLAEARAEDSANSIIPSDYPKVVRDLTLKVAKQTLASEVIKKVSKLKIPELASYLIVDDFAKEGEDFRRVSYRFVFQSPSRTLTSSEVDNSVKNLQGELEKAGYSLAL